MIVGILLASSVPANDRSSASSGTGPTISGRSHLGGPSGLTGPEVRPLLGTVALGSAVVRFGVAALGVSVSFAPSVSVANGTVGVGNRSTATVRFTAANATVALTVAGLSGTDVSVDALGTQSVLVPGINDTVGGVPLSIYLELNGQVNATTFVGANGFGGGTAVSWSSNGNRSVPFQANGPNRSEIEVGVTNLSYYLSVGVVARGTVGGFPVSVNLLAPAPLPTAPGTPSGVVGLFEVLAPPPPPLPGLPPKPPSSPPSPSSHPAPVPSWELALLIAAPILALVGLGLVLWRRSAARAGRDSVCASCGSRVPEGASFCPGCARPRSPGPPPPPSPAGPAP